MLCDKWNIESKNVYNMDKSGYCIGLHQKSQVIIPAEKAKTVAIAATNGNWEWAI